MCAFSYKAKNDNRNGQLQLFTSLYVYGILLPVRKTECMLHWHNKSKLKAIDGHRLHYIYGVTFYNDIDINIPYRFLESNRHEGCAATTISSIIYLNSSAYIFEINIFSKSKHFELTHASVTVTKQNII